MPKEMRSRAHLICMMESLDRSVGLVVMSGLFPLPTLQVLDGSFAFVFLRSYLERASERHSVFDIGC
jgi:hypothetical protein